MTTVWTASNLRRQDGRYNSLSRSLGSLMSIVLDEDKSPSVLIFSNQSPRETNLQTSVSVGDRVGDENILPLNGLSFRSLQTDSSSSIAFVGKKIKREYQSAFVLPDKQTIGIIRQEAFMTEEGLAQVTLSLCVSTHLDGLKVSKSERICDYLDTDYWASILLASTESHDAELLGYMGPEYTSRKPNRFNFERSESRRRKREIVLVQEEIEDSDEKGNVGQFDGSNILPESVTVYEKVYPKEKDECDPQTRRLILHPPPPLPPPQLPESPPPSPPKTLKVSERNASPKPQLTSSRNSCQPKEQAPIIGRAEPPGKSKPIVSSPKSKENFEKLKRQWNNRIAQMQEHLDNQYRDTPTSLPQTYTEGHRGSTVTSILPTVDKRSSDPYVKSRISSTDQRLSPEQAYDHQSLPDRTSMDHGSNKENFIFHSFDYINSSSPGSGDLVDPVTERCEKDAQFIYSQARLFVNQQNIGRLSPRKLSESSSMNDITKLKTSNLNHQQFEQLLIDNTVKYTELNNNNQSSISFLIDKLNIEQSSEQAYIYQSTYSRFPITIKNISSYHQNNNNKLITNKINNPMMMKELFNKFAKHELILNREPTYSFYIPIQLSTTELNIHRYSKTLPRYNNKYDMIIHVNDLHNSLDNNNNNVQYDMNMKQSIRHRMCTSLPRTKHALLYYSQPVSPRIVSNSSIVEDQQQQQRDIHAEFRNVDRGNRHSTTTETRSKVTDELPGHRRHPPPPLSPNSKEDIHYPRDGTVSRPRISDGSKAATPLTPTRHSSKNLGDDSEKRKQQQKLYDDEFKNGNREPMPLDLRKPITQFNYGILQHPDEYNYLAEAEKQKPTIDFASELSYDSSLYGKISQGSARKQPPIKHYDKYKDKKPDKPHRHPPPPQPTDHDQTKRLDDKPSPKPGRRSGHGMVSVDENYYVNVPGSGPPVIRPPYNGHKRSLQDLSERSGPHSAYDPRLGDTVIQPSKPRTSDRISDQMPDYYDQYTSDESDYDDSGESDEELRPPALRTITQTRRRSEPEPSNNYPPVQLRKQSKGQKTGQSITSIRDSLISPEVVNDTSSKHSLIISTKRRTLSGLTGTHPSKHRSSSMNTLWFGDHPVPSEHTISPATPVRLSNIQIQAQAELERRHRSSSHGHSLDRKSIYSTGMTESHLSKGLSDYHQGYEGIGYAYDNRGRLIHGGACLPERSASRKRRLLDGHESLSRVWIPQSGEHYPIKQISDKTPSSLMNRDERQAQLDNSAMAFALRDFNAPKIR
ncbi:unnamed protein product [Schistosoma intercalatum]|nr:unnamed protein product [Schistosoma intercalatum]CAH8549198.1 unnamed protein product [Schistosoma intercalatum]